MAYDCISLSNRSLARLLHRVAFVNSTLVRESLLAVVQWHRKCSPQPYKDSVDSLVKGWGQRCVTENGFNRCKDHQRNNKNLRMARAARRHYLKDSKVFENVYKRKEIVAEPTNFGGKGRPRLNKALYEYQSGEPSVPDEMLSAITGNASWQSPGPQSAHLIPLAFRLLLHCVEGFDSPNWRVENDGWRSAFSGGRLGGGENQHKHVSRDSGCIALWSLGVAISRGSVQRRAILTPRCSADSECVWLPGFSFEDVRCWRSCRVVRKVCSTNIMWKNKSPSAVHLVRSNTPKTIPRLLLTMRFWVSQTTG